MHERRVIFIVLLLGILFYVDNIYIGYWDAGSMIFPVFILLVISSDTIVIYFPRRLALVKMILIVLVLCWNVFYVTFLETNLQTIHAALGHIWRRYKFLHR